MKNDLIKRLEGHIKTLRGVASSVYSDDIREAVDALEQQTKTLGEADKQSRERLKRIEQLEAALADAKDHLDYCGYGDSWERECAVAQKLEEKIDAALLPAGGSGPNIQQDGYPATATPCLECKNRAVILMDGRYTCLACGDSVPDQGKDDG